MKLLDLDTKKGEYVNEKVDYNQMLTEAWASHNIMSMINIADKNSERAWYSSFIKDFYTIYNISIDKITDEDFQEIPVDSFFAPPYKKNRDIFAIFINDDKKLEQEAKGDVGKMVARIEQLKAGGVSKQEIESATRSKDNLKELKIPIIVAIAAGERVLYAGFNYDDNDKKISKWERYGVLSASWLARRYYGEHADIDVNKYDIANRSTRLFIVDVAKLKMQYDMGTKLTDRKEAKEDNPYFMTDEEIRNSNIQRYRQLIEYKLDPESIGEMYKTCMMSFMEYYMSKAQVSNEKQFLKFLDGKIDINMSQITSPSDVLKVIESNMNEYLKIYTDYLAFLKKNSKLAKQVDIKELTQGKALDANVRKYKDQLEGYINAFTEHREKAKTILAGLQDKKIIKK